MGAFHFETTISVGSQKTVNGGLDSETRVPSKENCALMWKRPLHDYIMTVLTKDVIKKEIELGRIKVTPPLEETQFGPASIDLSLSSQFRKFKHIETPIELSTNYEDITEPLDVGEDGYIDVAPNEIILGITKEQIELPTSICGLLEGRSRFARLGMLVHFTASIMAPGIKNK